MKKFDVTTLLIFIAGCELAGALSGIAAGGGFSRVYYSLERPPLTPPPFVFPILWGVLYALMGAAAYLVSLTEHRLKKTALRTFAVQLGVNMLYSPVFFGAGSTLGGLIVSALLTAAVGVTVVLFAKVRKLAAVIMVPYLLWTVFALYLAAGIEIRN